jgi:tRNA(Ile)-lysidine synthetase-like protein
VLPPGERLGFEHVERMVNEGQHVGFVTNLPADVRVRNEYGTLIVQRNSHYVEQCERRTFCVKLALGVRCALPQGAGIELFEVPPQDFAGDPMGYVRAHATAQEVFVDGAALSAAGGTGIEATNVREADRFSPLGMKGKHRLVSDLLIDCKVPRARRATQVVVRVGAEGRIVWIVGLQLDDAYKVTHKSNTIVGMRYFEA